MLICYDLYYWHSTNNGLVSKFAFQYSGGSLLVSFFLSGNIKTTTFSSKIDNTLSAPQNGNHSVGQSVFCFVLWCFVLL